MKKPVIGITSSYVNHNYYMEGLYVHHDYQKAVIAAGGVPIILPIAPPDVLDTYMELCDGFILSGGEDIDPQFYGRAPHKNLGPFYTERDESELYLTQQLLALTKPVLGICRGLQLMNVALGGTLIQDIPSSSSNAIQHVQKIDRPKEQHGIRFQGDSTLRTFFNQCESLHVNSLHHQAIDDLGKNLFVTSIAPDGMIESIEHKSHPFFIGVQWHPESMCQRSDTMNVLFEKLVKESTK